MIYVSSSCIHATTIREAVQTLAAEGYRNIELSGGTRYYPALQNDLLELQARYGLRYLCHNYFPPPAQDFVVNLASLDLDIFRLSLQHLTTALELSHTLSAAKFAFHAGFLINFGLREIGNILSRRELFERSNAFRRFCEGYRTLASRAGDIQLYVENNVLSKANLESYSGHNPFFITDFAGYDEFRAHIPLRPLLDVAHLKVSAQSLGLHFPTQLAAFLAETDYIHISDNDGLRDSNDTFNSYSSLFAQLEEHDFSATTITLEVYSGLEGLRQSYESSLRLPGVAL